MNKCEIDPSAVYVEQGALDRAKSFVEAEETLSAQRAELQEIAATHIARMMTAAEVQLFLAPTKQMCAKWVDMAIQGEPKTIVIIGTKADQGVMCEGCVLGSAKAKEMLSKL